MKGMPDPTRLRIVAEAIRTIETAHRPIEWRMVEYFCLLLPVGSLVLWGRLKNHSIGQYQFKVNMILDFLGMDHIVVGKTLVLKERRLAIMIQLLQNRNSTEVLAHYIDHQFPQVLAADRLSRDCLHDFAREYSRNNEFHEDVNYLSVMLFLLSESVDWSLLHADAT